MDDYKNYAMNKNEELIDVLLDFIIVAANLSKKINRAVKHKQNRVKGENTYVEDKRNGTHSHRAPQCCR